MKPSIFIIAEAGVNHNGDSKLAFELIDVAVEAGVDAIKFQTFKASNLVTQDIEKAEYQQHTTSEKESQFAMLKRLELTYETHHELLAYSQRKGIQFLSTAFDHDSLAFLVNDLGLMQLKIPSGEITNAPLVLSHAKTQLPIIVSTGMATIREITDTLSVLAFGFIYGNDDNVRPSKEAFMSAYRSKEGQDALREKVTLLHCTTEYPAPFADINLNAMKTMSDAFGLPVGYSDHSEGILVSVAAVAMGASVVEKHFTLDKLLPGPDHVASLDPDELKEMVNSIRSVEMIQGAGKKEPCSSELKNKEVARKSLVASQKIEKGEYFSDENLAAKRAVGGRSPMDYWELLGQKSPKNYLTDESIF